MAKQFLSDLLVLRTLDHLEDVATCFVNLAESLGRPMTSSEREGWGWIEEAFLTHSMRAQSRHLGPARQDKLQDTMQAVSTLLHPEDAEHADVPAESAELSLFDLVGVE